MANEQHDIYLKRDKKLFWNYAQAQGEHTHSHTCIHARSEHFNVAW